MATNYTTKTAALKATTADIRKLTAKTVFVDNESGTSTDILDLISAAQSATTYTAGDNIDITNNKISVDATDIYSSTGTEPVSGKAVASAIGGIAVESTGGNGVTASQTNGKVTLTVTKATTSAVGTVQLTDGVTSTSTTTAATPNAVKTAYDKAKTAQDNVDALDTRVTTAEGEIDTLQTKVNALESGKLTYKVVHSVAGNGIGTSTATPTFVETSGGSSQNCVEYTIYLVPNPTIGAYVEYLCCTKDSKLTLEQIGTTSTDLKDYAKTSEVTTAITTATGKTVNSTDGSDAEHVTVTLGGTVGTPTVTVKTSDIASASDLSNLTTKVGAIPSGSSATTVVGYAKEVADAAKAAATLEAGSGISISTANKISVSPTHTYSSGGETPVSGKAIAAAIGTLDSGNESNGVTYSQTDGKGSVTVVTATTGQYGTTQLLTSITSESEILAATPKAVKLAIADAATTAQSKANTALASAKTYADGINTTLTAGVKKATLTGTDGNGLSVSVTDDGTTVSMSAASGNTKGAVGLSDSIESSSANTDGIAATPLAVKNALAAAKTYADQAEADAISTAAGDATTKADAALAAAKTYADQAEADAISTAATTAQTKADKALSDAKAYTNTEIAAVREDLTELSGGAITTINGDTTSSELVKVTAAKKTGDPTTVNLTVTVDNVAKASDLTTLTQTVSTNKNTADTGIQEAKDAAAQALTDAKAHTNTEIGKIDAAYKAADNTLSGRIAANEDKLAGITGTVTAAIDAAEDDAISAAKTYTDGQISTLSGKAVKSIGVTDNAAHVTLASTAIDENGNVQLTLSESNIASADALSALDTKVTNHISDAAKLGIVVAEAAADGTPNVTSPSTNKIYLVAAGSPESGTYVEWIYVEKSDKTKVWEKIGTTATDLTEYAKAATVESDIETAKTEAINTAAGDATTKANNAKSGAEATAAAALETAKTELKTYADTAEADALASANSYTDNKIAALSTGNGAIAGIDSRVSTLETEVNTNIPKDIEDAQAAAATDATTKANKALADAKTYADTAEADAIASAAADATTKANKALSDAKDYTDAEIAALDKANHGGYGVTASQADGIITLSVAPATEVTGTETVVTDKAVKAYVDGINTTLTAGVKKATLTGTTNNGLTVNVTSNGTTVSMAAADTSTVGTVKIASAISTTGTVVPTAATVKNYVDTTVANLDSSVTSTVLTGLTISQENGKLSGAEFSVDTKPTSGSTKAVTSGAVHAFATKVQKATTTATADVTSATNSTTGATTYTIDTLSDVTITATAVAGATTVEGNKINGANKYVDWERVTNASGAFQGNTSLTKFHADLNRLTTGTNMFSGCTGLTSFCGDLGSLAAGGADGMFSGCKLDEDSVIYIIESLPTVTGGKITIGVASTVTSTMKTAYGNEASAKGWTVTW